MARSGSMSVTGSSAGATQTMGYTITGVSDPARTTSFPTPTALRRTTVPASFSQRHPRPSMPRAPLEARRHRGRRILPFQRGGYRRHGQPLHARHQDALVRHLLDRVAAAAPVVRLQVRRLEGYATAPACPTPRPGWDTNGDRIPDNYFFVTNPSMLEAQLSNAFDAILAHAGSASWRP